MTATNHDGHRPWPWRPHHRFQIAHKNKTNAEGS